MRFSYKRNAFPQPFGGPAHAKQLFEACARASTLGFAILDSDFRFQVVNESLARETQAPVDRHIGRTSFEVVGQLAEQIQGTYEHVFDTGQPSSVLLVGHVRDNPETGQWLDYCFPIRDKAGRVQQLGLFVLDVTAEHGVADILHALAGNPARCNQDYLSLISEFDCALVEYREELVTSMTQLVQDCAELARTAALMSASVGRLDRQIRRMRALVDAVIADLSLASC